MPPPNIGNSFSLSNVIVNTNIINSPGTDAEVITGGLFGQSNAVVANSYSNGSVMTSLTSDASSFGTTFYTGGVAGLAFSLMTNTYSLSPVTVSGINKGGQFFVGGLVGAFTTLFDKEISTSFSAGTVTVNATNENGGQLYIGGFVGTWIYYGAAATTWPFMNDYSFSNLNISGTNNASTAAIGGFMGTNGQDAGDPGGNIINSYSAGTIHNSLTTTNAGVTDLGGFIGLNTGTSATLNNNFWDTTTSNLTQGVGNTPGAVSGLTPGCFSGACQPNGGTANLSQQSTFDAAGWDFATIWSIDNSISYPYFAYSSFRPDGPAPIPPTPPVPPIPPVPNDSNSISPGIIFPSNYDFQIVTVISIPVPLIENDIVFCPVTNNRYTDGICDQNSLNEFKLD